MPASIRQPIDQKVLIEPLTPVAFAPFGTVIQNPAKARFPSPLSSIEANQGSATKYSDVSPLVSSYSSARSAKPASPKVSMFSCRPRALRRTPHGQQFFNVKILERHPFTPQTFIPTGLAADDRDTAYLVIVAPTLSLAHDVALEEEFHDAHRSPTLVQRLLGSTPIPSSMSPTARPKPHGLPDLANIRAFVARGDQAVTYGAGTWHAPMVVLGKQTIDFVVLQYANGVGAEDCQEIELRDGNLDVVVEEDLVARHESQIAKL
ncbi:hypothetical protein AMS68_006069 [Peltaster fructicola]|uniref:Ureidoglycolate hydrolase n=1 Tax=Peltaster fructicola TaxID=286661 RepID=A0A6H0Y0J4_9PEZI|nr:hypothetical protein AMS68_006069 [Peltaster fructicola]